MQIQTMIKKGGDKSYGGGSPHVWFIQNILAPYRIPLFKAIAEKYKRFQVILLAQTEKRRSWDIDFSHLPFESRIVRGLRINTGYERQLNLNCGLFILAIRCRPDIVVAAGFSIATIILLVYVRCLKKKLIVWFEGIDEVSTTRTLLRRIILLSADAYIVAGAVTDAYARRLSGKPDSRTFLIKNCIDTEYFAESAKLARLSMGARSREDQPTILFCGQFIDRKGVMELLHAFALVKKALRNASLKLVGNGPLLEQMQQYTSENKLGAVTFYGPVEYNDMPHYYGSADVFVLPCHHDHNPLVLIEAMVSGLPVVVSDGVDSAVDYVEEGINGYIVPTGNVELLSEKIIAVLTSPKWENLSAAAASIRESVSIAHAAESFDEAIRSVI